MVELAGQWMHFVKEGKEILIGIYSGDYRNAQELIETLDKEGRK